MKVSKLAIKTGMLTIVVALSTLVANAQDRERFGISAKATFSITLKKTSGLRTGRKWQSSSILGNWLARPWMESGISGQSMT